MNNADFDIGPLSWVKDEIDIALTQGAAQLQRYGADHDAAALAEARANLHQVRGALAVVGIEGVTRFAQAIEHLLDALDTVVASTPAHGELLQESIAALRRYLEDIVAGRPDQPLRLMPLYERLRQQLPADELAQSDAVAPALFLPDLARRAPRRDAAVAVSDPQARQMRLKAARLAFERGLTKWSQQDVAGLRDMRHAVAIIESLQATEPARTFWWITLAWLDALMLGGSTDADAARRLSERLDAQVHRALGGAQAVSEQLMRDVLYGVATASASNEHIEQVRAVFNLKLLLPASEKTQEAALDEMRIIVAEAIGGWEQFRDGAAIALPRFHDLSTELHRLAKQLAHIDLGRLTAMVASVAGLMRRNPLLYTNALADEIALALLLAETAINQFAALGAEFSAMVDKVVARVDALQRSHAAPPHDLPALVALAQRAQRHSLVQRLTGDLRIDLRLVEKALDGFFRGNASTEALIAAALPLQKIAGMFEQIEQPRAVEVTRECTHWIEEFGAPGSPHGTEDFAALARKISALGLYVEQLQHGPADLDALLGITAPGGEAAHDAERGEETIPAKVEPDAELVAIFIDEVDQIRDTIDMQLMRSVQHPDNPEHLAILRRCFHTLKGSSRMVGLQDFSDMARAVETVLNRYLEDGGTATPALHGMLDNARHLVSDWAARLQRKDTAPDAKLLLLQCDALRLAQEAPPAVASAEETPPPPPAMWPEETAARENVAEATVKVGTVTLARPLFETYINEAQSHLAVLAAWTPEANPDLAIRAAHTLASSSAAIGVVSVHALAQLLEKVMGRFAQAGRRIDGDNAETLNVVVRQLAGMVDAIAQGRLPELDSALAARLEAIQPPPEVPPVPQATANARSLLPLFLEECDDLVPAVTAAFRDWQEAPSGAAIDALRRALHTLKGGARMAGQLDLGEAVHDIETRIEALAQQASPTEIAALADAFADVASRIDVLRSPPRIEDAGDATLRVPTSLMESMTNESGEIAIARTRIESGVRSLRTSLADLSDNVARLRGHLRELEIQAELRMQSNSQASAQLHKDLADDQFDPLEMDRFTRLQELTRVLAESVDDVATIEYGVVRELDRIDGALSQQARLSRGLTQRLMGVRMVPFASIVERLQRVVQQTAQECGKETAFTVEGGATELDRSMLERITGPIEHLLRNAVVHGVEVPVARAAAGKARAGIVRLSLTQAGNEMVMTVEDDGAGLDFARIRSIAVERGLLAADTQATEAQLAQCIFTPGFTTASTLSENAGRGVGMDVVKNEIARLGGHVDVQSAPGRGTRFSLHLPLTLAVVPVVLVKAVGQTFGIPASMVVHAHELKPEAMAQLRGDGGMTWQEQRYALFYLAELFGKRDAKPLPQRRHWVLLLRAGAQRIALEIDAMAGNEEVVIKNIGPQLARLPGITGATVLGDGEIVLLVNPVALAERAQATAPVESAPAAATRPRIPVVMVVDDSLTVRKVTGRLLERAGYRVMTAKDGVDALEQLADVIPDVLLADIEMPRMDGFELIRRLRADGRLAALPIITITSRSADKHRSYALELGVNHYLGKPYDEEALLALIAEYVKQPQPT